MTLTKSPTKALTITPKPLSLAKPPTQSNPITLLAGLNKVNKIPEDVRLKELQIQEDAVNAEKARDALAAAVIDPMNAAREKLECEARVKEQLKQERIKSIEQWNLKAIKWRTRIITVSIFCFVMAAICFVLERVVL